MSRVFLDESNESWVETDFLPEDIAKYASKNFDELFALRPDKDSYIIKNGINREAHRRYESYLNTPKFEGSITYMFSDADGNCTKKAIPEKFKPITDHLTREGYNQVVINWYENGDEYIPFHRDYPNGLVDGSDIKVLSINKDGENGKFRTFRLFPHKKTKDSLIEKYNIETTHGKIITINEKCNIKFLHGMPSTKENVSPRISISFRKYK